VTSSPSSSGPGVIRPRVRQDPFPPPVLGVEKRLKEKTFPPLPFFSPTFSRSRRMKGKSAVAASSFPLLFVAHGKTKRWTVLLFPMPTTSAEEREKRERKMPSSFYLLFLFSNPKKDREKNAPLLSPTLFPFRMVMHISSHT